MDRFDRLHTGRRSHATASNASQPAALDKSDIHPMFGYLTRTLKALFLMQGQNFTTEFRQKVEKEHNLSEDEKIWLSEKYRNMKTYDEFLDFLCGTHKQNDLKKSNFLPFWQTLAADGTDDTIASTKRYKNFLQSVIANHGPLAYVDRISSSLSILGLEPHFYTEKECYSWDR